MGKPAITADTPAVRERLKRVMDEGQGKLVIDMDKVSFIDSNACAVLIPAFKGRRLRSGRLILVAGPVVQALIELIRLEILPTLPVAVAAFANGR
jgi:anti-sigma B factor antagonist